MANDNICVFCGQKIGTFRTGGIRCGNTWQTACKSCEKELKDRSEVELCNLALARGLADRPDELRERIDVVTEAENYRRKCLRCGTLMFFMKVQALDNSPLRDTIFKEPFEVLPAYCETCGMYEFYNPEIARKNKYIAYLIRKDTQI